LRPILTTGLLIFIATLVVYVLSLNGVWAVDHATSFLELDYSMWTRHSFILGSGSFKPNSVDDFEYNGNWYSALAPGTPILALPLVAVGFILDGQFTVFGHATVLSELFVALTNALAASLVYLVGRFFFDKKISAFLAFVYAFSTISWPFAAYFFQSDVSAMFCLMAVYFTIRATRYPELRLSDAAIAGIAVAVGMLVDYIDAIFLPIILLYIVLLLRGRKESFVRPAIAFASTAALGLVLIGLYNYVNFGDPLRGTEQLYLHASSLLTEFSYPLNLGVYLNLFSPYRGLFVYSIFLVMGVFGFYEMLKRSRYNKEAVLLLACFLGIFIPYSMWYDPSGGEGFGPRFLVAAIPFLVLPAGIVIERGDRKTRVLAYVLYGVGVVMNGIAGLTSAVTPMYNPNVSSFLTWTLPLFLRGGMDTWWLQYVGRAWPVPSAVIIGFALFVPALSSYLIDRGESKRTMAETPVVGTQ
jgi:hypothetical protein